MRDKIPARVKEVDLNKTWEKVRKGLLTLGSEAKLRGSSAWATSLAFLQVPDLLKWTESLTEAAATVYDKAMDAEFIKTGIGGAEHRLFDGGHTIIGSWRAVQDALPDDTIVQEVIGWSSAYVKDWTTTMGMPIATLDKANFDGWVEAVTKNVPLLDRRYLYDLCTFDAMETLSAALGVVGVLFCFQKRDKGRLGEILGAMGILSIMAANPIMGIATVASTAYAYWKHGSVDTARAVRGGGMAAISVVLFSVMALPLVVELVIVLTVTTLLRKHIVDNKQIAVWLRSSLEGSLLTPENHAVLNRLASMIPGVR